MKKLIILVMILMTTAMADIKLDFFISVRKKGCEVEKWVENNYENGILWQQYARVICKDAIPMPVNIVGLKFLDVATNLKGQYVYFYGLEK